MVVIALPLAGCAGTAVGLRSTNSPPFGGGAPPPGSAYSTASIQAEVRPGLYLGLMFLGYVLTGIQDNYRRWSHGFASGPAPEMAEDRIVVERDCSRPLGPLYANLRCVPAAH
jgi:hypothetical protein